MLVIVKIKPNEIGAHDYQTSNLTFSCPEGWAIVPDSLYMTDFYAYNGFVTLAIVNGTVTALAPNIEAWEASLPEPKPPTMTTEEAILDKLTEIEYRQDLAALGLTEGGVTGE